MNLKLKLATLVMASLMSSAYAIEHFSEDLNVSEYPHAVYGYTDQALTDGIELSYTETSSANDAEEGSISKSMKDTVLVCSEDVIVKRSMNRNLVGRKIKFDIYDPSLNGGNVTLIMKNKNTVCDYQFTNSYNTTKTIHISSFSKNLAGIKGGFSPANPNEEYTFLENGVDAINKRIEILTGQRVSNAAILNRNPAMPLDFSKMPKYDFILFTTLQFNNDYVSNIMFRALAEHAKRGTPVVVLGNQPLIGKKEQALLDWLQIQSPLIKILKYRYKVSNGTVKEKLDTIHRVSHAKIFATYSAAHPELNHFLSGGRNTSDRYFFEDFKKFDDPKYTQFDKEVANKWAVFFDLEFYVNSESLVKTAMIETLKLLKMRIFEDRSKDSEESDTHYTLSVPYNDGHKLVKEFVDAINLAEKDIKVLSPYIYFNEEIGQALKEAAARGVRIEIITSASLIGDDMTKKVKQEYDNFLVLRKDYLNVYSYKAESHTVMHRKAMLIDEQLLMLGSVNLSQRSFIHDIEVNYKFTNQDAIQKFIKVYNKMLTQSEEFNVPFTKTTIGRMINGLELRDIL